ncbi:hypothetical protein [Methanobacterium formicicum]|uniref:Uncharacterized protein n=1 Tax=Methanobacterium formicicum TaxID=2162 RepID=A0A843AV19_METFO|nr:hypothetical protein [Methanobacterium formicicum]MBF4474575.1 hypothetical protein [Methanobacterium formicicum]
MEGPKYRQSKLHPSMAPSHTPLPEGGALETITKQPNIIYENKPLQSLSIISREYSQNLEKLLTKTLLTTEVPK